MIVEVALQEALFAVRRDAYPHYESLYLEDGGINAGSSY
jgi:hypothetical protein